MLFLHLFTLVELSTSIIFIGQQILPPKLLTNNILHNFSQFLLIIHKNLQYNTYFTDALNFLIFSSYFNHSTFNILFIFTDPISSFPFLSKILFGGLIFCKFKSIKYKHCYIWFSLFEYLSIILVYLFIWVVNS